MSFSLCVFSLIFLCCIFLLWTSFNDMLFYFSKLLWVILSMFNSQIKHILFSCLFFIFYTPFLSVWTTFVEVFHLLFTFLKIFIWAFSYFNFLGFSTLIVWYYYGRMTFSGLCKPSIFYSLSLFSNKKFHYFLKAFRSSISDSGRGSYSPCESSQAATTCSMSSRYVA